MEEGKIAIYTDGSCLGNPGPGGWACVFVRGSVVFHKISGRDNATTNNKMELMAVISALGYCKEQNLSGITIYTDSVYVKDGITKWIHNWKIKGWKTANKDPVKNKDLWVMLDEISSCVLPSWAWVKAHADNLYNNMADELARSEAINMA